MDTESPSALETSVKAASFATLLLLIAAALEVFTGAPFVATVGELAMISLLIMLVRRSQSVVPASVAMGIVSLVTFGATLIQFSRPVVGDAERGLVSITALFAPCVLLTIATMATTFVLHAIQGRRLLSRPATMACAASLALVAVAGLVGVAATRGARKPDITHYLRDLEPESTIEVPATTDDSTFDSREVLSKDLAIAVKCRWKRCFYALAVSDADLQEHPRDVTPFAAPSDAAEPVVVRRDRDSDVVIVTAAGRDHAFRPVLEMGSGTRLGQYATAAVDVADVAARKSAPITSIGVAAHGLAMAALALLAALSAWKRVDPTRDWLPCEITEDGQLHPTTDTDVDARTARRAPEGFAAGPVLVDKAALSGRTYRLGDAVPSSAIVSGTRQDRMEERRRDVLRSTWAALAILATTTAPLLAAAWFGLVF
ncbi:MAG: hypothetical protein U0271_31185 [Polyangiaceae bacterium]